MAIGAGSTDRMLTEDEARGIFAQGLAALEPKGKRLLFIIPDGTRSAPLPLCFRAITDATLGLAAKVDFLVALGTHLPMSEEALRRHVGITQEEREGRYAQVGLYNHDWKGDLLTIGTLTREDTRDLSDGMIELEVPVQVNPRIMDYDHLVVVGPVFPHEVVGFSGGSKYFFPGISGPAVIDFTHWLGALRTSRATIGHEDTPVRAAIDKATGFIDRPISCFSMVVRGHHDLAGLYYGGLQESQRAAAALSAQVNVVWVDKPYQTVLSVMPTLYDDVWTGAKGMYKMEPVVADGGMVIIYAPHIDEISYTHGKYLDEFGYHVRDYFLAQWDRYKGYPWGVLAHSTHVKGDGTYVNGVESPRIQVELATGVPKERCERINLGYRDPASIDVSAWQGREDEGILVVPRAGEMLYRLKDEQEGA